VRRLRGANAVFILSHRYFIFRSSCFVAGEKFRLISIFPFRGLIRLSPKLFSSYFQSFYISLSRDFASRVFKVTKKTETAVNDDFHSSIMIAAGKYRGVICFSVCDRNGFRKKGFDLDTPGAHSTRNERRDLLIG